MDVCEVQTPEHIGNSIYLGFMYVVIAYYACGPAFSGTSPLAPQLTHSIERRARHANAIITLVLAPSQIDYSKYYDENTRQGRALQ